VGGSWGFIGFLSCSLSFSSVIAMEGGGGQGNDSVEPGASLAAFWQGHRFLRSLARPALRPRGFAPMPWLPAGSMPSMALGLPVMPPAMPALRAAPFVHDASYVKASFLAAIAKGEASWPLVSKEAAVEMLTDSIKVPVGQVTNATRMINRTGLYKLVVSNCGYAKGLKLSGSIGVKHHFGYLPGNEYYRLPLYGCAALIWAVAGVVWAALVMARRSMVVSLHWALVWTIAVGFSESVAWWYALSAVNRAGAAPFATYVAEVLSVLRSTSAMIFILIAAAGFGVMEADISMADSIKDFVGGLAVSLADKHRVCFASNQQPDGRSDMESMLVVYLPVGILSTALFVQVLCRLASSMRRCKELNQKDSLKNMQRSAIISLACMVCAAGVAFARFRSKPGRGPEHWESHVIWIDGVPQVLILAALVATMCTTAPSKAYLTGAYGKAAPQDGDLAEFANGAPPCAEDAQDDFEEDKTFLQPAANTIGAKAPAGIE